MNSNHTVLAACIPDCPILLLDTCLLLDLIRAPVRDNVGVHDINAATELYDRAKSTPPKAVIVVNDQVKQEFTDNVAEVTSDVSKRLKKMSDDIKSTTHIMSCFAGTPKIPSPLRFDDLGFPQTGKDFAENFLNVSFEEKINSEDTENGFNRVRHATPPASRGKESTKDCVIIENFIRITGNLRKSGFDHRIVFATSNTRDYQQGQPQIDNRLATDFTALNLVYAPGWGAARHEMDRVFSRDSWY